MHALVTWLMAGSPPHYASALAVLAYAVLEWVLPRTKLVAANSTLELLANLGKKALVDRVPLVGKLVAFLATPEAVPAIVPAKKRSGKLTTIIGFLAGCLALHGCACFGQKAQNTPACVVLHQVIDCSGGAAVSNVAPIVVAIVGSVIAGQTSIDWGGVLARLEGAGIKDAACILAALESDFAAHPSPLAPSYKAAFANWKAAHGLSGVRIKLAAK